MAKNLKDIYAGVKKNSEDRVDNDFYPTPPLATYILHKYIDLPKNIVEPCAGRGNISKELERNGYNVRSFDAFHYEPSLTITCVGQNVLDLPKQEGFDALVTNPPFFKDLPRKITEKGIQEYDLTAMFVRLTFLESKGRGELFAKHPPSDIIFLSDRIRFGTGLLEPIERSDQLGGMIAYCWVVFRKGHDSKNANLRWVMLSEEYDEWRRNYDEYNNFKGITEFTE